MKIKVLLLFLFTLSVIIQARDTAVVMDINFDRVEEKIEYIDHENGQFTLRINKTLINGQFVEGYDAFIDIIDMDRNDNLKEIAVMGFGSSDYTECFFYQFVNGEIIPCGYLPGNFGIKAKGNKILKENIWMGFYSIEFAHKFDTENKTLTFIKEDLYIIDVRAEVTMPFEILKFRYDNSAVVQTLKPKSKITLMKVDINPKCSNEEIDYKFDDNCDWFLIKTEDGVQGWCRLKDFRDNVEGLIWAG